MEPSVLEDLARLQERLTKICEARRKNAKLREILKKRLLIIESKIFIQTSTKNKLESFYYDIPKVWGFSYTEYTKLSQLFWGRNLKKPEDHASYNKTFTVKLTMNDKRILFLNQHRSSRQESLLITKDDKYPVVFSRQLPVLPPISIKQYSIHDVIRYYVFIKIFGNKFPINSIYPHISTSIMKSRLKELKSAKNTPELESLGINSGELQSFISCVLINL